MFWELGNDLNTLAVKVKLLNPLFDARRLALLGDIFNPLNRTWTAMRAGLTADYDLMNCPRELRVT